MSLATTAVVVGIIAGVAAIAGVSYTVYSSENPPKNPEQATQALNRNQLQISKLQAKRDQYSVVGKDTSKIDDAINKVNESISFLTGWITKFGNTKAPSIADKKFAAISDTQTPFSNQPSSVTIPGAPILSGDSKLWTALGVVGIVVVLILLVVNLFKKGK